MSENTVDVTFSVKGKPARKSRYTLSNVRETAEGGRVGVGVDGNGNDYLVHEIGRQTEAITLGAVATAVANGAVPIPAIIAAFEETGHLGELHKQMSEYLKPKQESK